MKDQNKRSGFGTFGVKEKLMAGAWGLCLVVGLIGLYHRMTTGHAMAGYGSYVPWGIWVSLYFQAVGMAAGVFVVSAIGYVFDLKGFASRSMLRNSIVLAFAAMLPGLLAVGLDLGRFERASSIFLSPDFGSVMTVNAFAYNVFMVAAAGIWFLTWRKESSWIKPLALFGAIVAIVYATGSGLFFGGIKVKPEWHGSFWPVLTLVSGLTAGAALLFLVRARAFRADDDAGDIVARRVLMAGIVLYAFLTAVEKAATYWYTPAHAMPGAVASPSMAVLTSLWFRLGCGLVLPFVILMWKRTGAAPGFAALLVIAGTFGGRYEYAMAGQAPTAMPSLVDAFHHSRLTFSYDPSVMELQVALLLLAIGVAVYVTGRSINIFLADKWSNF